MCMIDINDDRPEFSSDRTLTARKEHKCVECGRSIGVGERYRRSFMKQDGAVYDAKTCAHCDVACSWLVANCNGYIYEAVIEDFQEHATPCMPMLRIVVGARRQWKSFADPARLLAMPAYPADMM
jgi:hypothetical protein